MTTSFWSDKEQDLIAAYQFEKCPHKLAKHFGTNYRSVISKLVSLEIYEKPTRTKRDGKTAKQLWLEIENTLNIRFEWQNWGVNLGKKENLEILVSALKAKLEALAALQGENTNGSKRPNT